MKKIALLISLLMLAVLMSGSAFAATKKAVQVQTLIGKILKIDTTAGTVTIKTRHKEFTVKGEPQLLSGITVGERVRFEKSGDMLKSIQELKHKTMHSAPAASATHAAPPASN